MEANRSKQKRSETILNCIDTTLIIPQRADTERDAVAGAWTSAGGTVYRIDRFWDPPEWLLKADVRLYGNDTFCMVLAQKLQRRLVSPPDDLIASVPAKWLGRDVRITSLADARTSRFPSFVKPLIPKQFTASVYGSSQELVRECHGLPDNSQVIVSSVVNFLAEARAFIRNGVVLDCAVYEGHGSVANAIAVASSLAVNLPLPATCVLDVGLLQCGTWVFIESNAAWGAGLNGCSATKVLPAIMDATVKL